MTLEIITSPSLEGVAHGFFTRRGGASSGIYTGLNCGGGSDDQRDAVALNRARVAAAMGVAPEALASVDQTHSTNVLTVSAPFDDPRPEADGMVTATQGVALTVLTADCEPVLFADPAARVIGAEGLLRDRPGFEVEFLTRGSIPPEMHATDQHEILMPVRGYWRLTWDGGTTVLNPGDTCAVQPGMAHALAPSMTGEASLYRIRSTDDPAGATWTG